MPPESRPHRARRATRIISVRTRPIDKCTAWVTIGPLRFRAALGRGGIRHRKREGDGATPVGTFRLLILLFRRDRCQPPKGGLPMRQIADESGWCDDPASPNYNRPVPLPARHSAETLARADRLYDMVAVLDHNIRPRKRGAGSAIFLHVAAPDFRPTEGCIALKPGDLRHLLALAGPRCAIVTGGPPIPVRRRRTGR